MNSWEEQPAEQPGPADETSAARRPSAPANAARVSKARQVAHAVAEREQGRRRLNATTVTVTLASVAVTGVVAAVLPGTSSHAATTSTGSSSSSSSSSSDSNGSSSNLSSNQNGLQAPANSPQSGGSGGSSSTSGGT